MSDYAVDRLSIERIEGFARELLAECPKLANGAIDILANSKITNDQDHPWRQDSSA